MPLIKYVGKKDIMVDNVADTGLVWTRGQAQEVPAAKVPLLLRHPDVWAQVKDAPEPESDPDVKGALALLDKAQNAGEGDKTEPAETPPIAPAPPPVGNKPDFDEEGNPVIIPDPLPNMTAMTKDALSTLGQTRFGVHIDQKMTKQEMQEYLLTLERAGRAA